jgi:preprotein translocase subunit Sec61beta
MKPPLKKDGDPIWIVAVGVAVAIVLLVTLIIGN